MSAATNRRTGEGAFPRSPCFPRPVPLMLALVATIAVRPSAHDPIRTRVTWTGDIRRIVEARCAGCHRPDGKGPMALTTYEEARPWAKAIREEVLTRRMPKWQAVRGYGDFRNDPSLSSFEIALIAAWAEGGAPKGTAAIDPPPLRAPASSSAGGDVAESVVPCNSPLPPGYLAGIRPALSAGGSVGLAVEHADGARDIVGLIRGYDPKFPTTYWLRVPVALTPGSRLVADVSSGPAEAGRDTTDDRCTVALAISSSR
jgi:mono/diheme cytochrome c family protein